MSIPAPAISVEWETSIKDLLAVFASFTLLVAWLVCALVLWWKRVFVPLKYFDFDLGDDSSWYHASIGNSGYNTAVTVAGSLTGAIIGYGISQGFKAKLRRTLLGRGGVSLYHYEAMVKYSAMGVQLKWRWSAVVALFLFACAQLFSGATQAAFGSSLDTTNLTATVRFARLSDNGPVFQQSSLQTMAGNAPGGGDADSFVDAALLLLTQGAAYDPPVTVLTTSQNVLGRSLFNAAHLRNIVYSMTSTEPDDSIFSPSERALISASGQRTAYAEVEGFDAAAECAQYPLDVSHTLDSATGLVRYDFVFDCGSRTAYYDSTVVLPIVADSYACTDGSPIVYYWIMLSTLDTSPAIFRCSVAASSSIQHAQVYAEASIGLLVGPAQDEAPIPDTFSIADFLGADLLNNFGHSGWKKLAGAMVQITKQQTLAQQVASYNAFFEFLTATLAKGALARVSAALTQLYESNWSQPPVVPTGVVGHFQVQALRIHLRGYLLAWIIVPILLLLILTYSSLYFLSSTGQTDFTDPVSTALIGIASDDNDAVRGSSTGEFPTSWSPFKKDPVDLKKVWLAFGEQSATRLQFTAHAGTRMAFGLTPPKKGHRYE
ncbi:hypothetical protein JCM10207_007568 [Rhodosporidiobolus poonsookiae]